MNCNIFAKRMHTSSRFFFFGASVDTTTFQFSFCYDYKTDSIHSIVFEQYTRPYNGFKWFFLG